MEDFKFEITKKIAVLSTNKSGWTVELNMVSYNDREPKYDIRNWSPDHKKMGKGVTLTQEEEVQRLLEALEEEFDDEEED